MMRTQLRQSRRGAVLFEVMLSIALFVGAAAFVMSAVRSGLHGLDRAQREQQAVDLARSKMAQLRAGMVNLEDLRGEQFVGVGSIDHFNEQSGAQPLWTITVQTQRTQYAGLSLVELTVAEQSDRVDAATFTLRQLVRLREIDPDAYQDDAMLEGLLQ